MASEEIGGQGLSESQPVFYNWRWYYYLPILPLWALLVLLLVVPKQNRRLQAWLIFIPIGLVMVLWNLLAMLLSLPDESAELSGSFIQAIVMAWSVVWLVGHWFGARSRTATFFPILGVFLAIGFIYYLSYFSGSVANLLPLSIGFIIYVIILPIAMLLSSYFCRRKYSPLRFLGWLLLWIGAVTLGLLFLYFAVIGIVEPRVWPHLIFTLPLSTLSLGGTLYLLNLPFMVLAFKSPFYRQRFENIFLLKALAR